MKKQILADGIIYLISMIAAVLLNIAVSALTVRLGLSLAHLGYFGRSVVRLVTGFAVCGGVLGAMVYRESYRSMKFSPGILIPAVTLAGLVHLLVCLPFKFYPFIGGGVRDLAGIMSQGFAFSSEEMIAEIRFVWYIVAFVIFLLFELLVAVLCSYFGRKHRLKNREGLNLCDSDGTTENT